MSLYRVKTLSRWEGVNDAHDLPGCSLPLSESFAFFGTWPSVQTRFLVLLFLCIVILGAVVGTERYSGVMARLRDAQQKKCFRKWVWCHGLSSKHRSWAERVSLKACSWKDLPHWHLQLGIASHCLQDKYKFWPYLIWFASFLFIHSNTASLVFIWFKGLFRLVSTLTHCTSWLCRVSEENRCCPGECFSRGGRDLHG